ncbi:MAG: HAD-IIB family hydrolase [Bacteroidales bacterium]|nr:HAD-IIB family hydrolase [Bacteroidales bacterium]
MKDYQEMVVTDLDGTLLNDRTEVSLQDMKTLYWLGEQNIVRVIATGRNFFSLTKVIKKKFPIDYLVFSSGAGVYDWKKKKLLHSQYLPDYEVKQIAKILINHSVDFMIHEVIPDNHKFVFYHSGNHNPDFERRISVYKDFAQPLNPKTETYEHACQILAVFPNDVLLFDKIKRKFKDIKIIRTTSPLDGDSIWMEIFPITVSKGHGVEWLCRYLKIDPQNTLSIGNDFNDIDMLEFTRKRYIVSNAPPELKSIFPVCKSNCENGFTDAVSRHFAVQY